MSLGAVMLVVLVKSVWLLLSALLKMQESDIVPDTRYNETHLAELLFSQDMVSQLMMELTQMMI